MASSAATIDINEAFPTLILETDTITVSGLTKTSAGSAAIYTDNVVTGITIGGGSALTGSAALSLTAGAAGLTFTANSTSYALNATGVALTTTAQTIIEAINEVDAASGGGSDLATVLVAGNDSGSRSFNVSVNGYGMTSDAGLEIDVTAGAGASSGDAGGNIDLNAGSGNTGGNSVGGVITVNGGDSYGTSTAGSVTITGGIGRGNGGLGGAANLRGGSGNGLNASGGSVDVKGGSANGTGTGGALFLTSGQTSTGTSGIITLASGTVSGSGTSGDVRIHAGTASSGTVGDVTIGTYQACDVSIGEYGGTSTPQTISIGQQGTGVITTRLGSNIGASGTTIRAGTGNLVVTSAGTASITTGSSSDLTLTARGDSITLNESGEEALNPRLNASSIVGSINMLSKRAMQAIPVAFTASLTAVDGVFYIMIPDTLDGLNLIRAQARVITAGTGSSTTIDIYNVDDTVDMLSTPITIADGATLGTAGVIDTNNDDISTDDLLRIDITTVASTTAPLGLIVVLTFG